MKFLFLFTLSAISIAPHLVGQTALALATTVEYCDGMGLNRNCIVTTSSATQCVNVDLALNDKTHSTQITSGNCVCWVWTVQLSTSTLFVAEGGRTTSRLTSVVMVVLRTPGVLATYQNVPDWC
ncbi:hypothetical protein B0H17DRAFT_1140654 [Mycena rosella]|uniref:Uncharacterized protein n=1 Tax=Mycena rosella TaxID=1033263 RepID=A0AAD7D5A2_MYCRO|nr:hypothetical protein B0H17DRAFT_1140654 [Mycena rosella]